MNKYQINFSTPARDDFILVLVILFSISLIFITQSSAVTGDELLASMYEMSEPVIDAQRIFSPDSLAISGRDIKITLKGGELAFFHPFTLGNHQYQYGAYYKDDGILKFTPPEKLERDQLNRYFETDTLSKKFNEILLFFNEPIYTQIKSQLSNEKIPFETKLTKKANKLLEELTRNKRYGYIFRVLKNNVEPRIKPYLLALAVLGSRDKVIYEYNPYSREQVIFKKAYNYSGSHAYYETVNRYAVGIDSSFENIDGTSKSQLEFNHYDIDASLSRSGELQADVTIKLKTQRTPSQMFYFYLHPEMLVDSVIGPKGKQVTFHRYEKRKNRRSELFLFFDTPLPVDQEFSFRFFYHGEVAEKDLGIFFVHASNDWYPDYVYSTGRRTFNMQFKSDKYYSFVASGKELERKEVGDTLFTKWETDYPVHNASFNIGSFEQYEFKDDSAATVEVNFSEDLHQSFGAYFAKDMISVGKHMEEQVGDDILNSLKLFSNYFGKYTADRISVSEIMYSHGEAFPGFLHLGFSTWINTDRYGWDRLFRAHEVAHQWWGVGVGSKTYHDKWLTEGFSEYSALLYIQAAAGNDQFNDRLSDYCDDIFSARKFLFGSGAESGPIALGYRTSGSKTSGDYSLVIYKKGAFVLHMIRNLLINFETMDESRFFNMMKDWYATYKGTDVSTKQFQALLEKHIGVDMTWFIDQWIYGTDLPEYKFEYEINKRTDSNYQVSCIISQKNVSDNFKMYVPIDLDFGNGSHYYTRVLVDAPEIRFDLPPLAQKPKKIKLNPFNSVLAKVKD